MSRPKLFYRNSLFLVEPLEADKNGFFASLSKGACLHVCFRLYEVAFVEVPDNCVEAGYHLSGEVDQLKIQLSVKLSYVFSLYFKDRHFLKLLQIIQFDTVDLLTYKFSVTHSCFFKLKNEPLNSSCSLPEKDGGTVDKGVGVSRCADVRKGSVEGQVVCWCSQRSLYPILMHHNKYCGKALNRFKSFIEKDLC